MWSARLLAILVLVAGPALGAVEQPAPPPSGGSAPPAPATPPETATAAVQIAEFCGRAHLSISAYRDCRKQMDAARTDEERVRVEHTFAMGNVAVIEPSGR